MTSVTGWPRGRHPSGRLAGARTPAARRSRGGGGGGGASVVGLRESAFDFDSPEIEISNLFR